MPASTGSLATSPQALSSVNARTAAGRMRRVGMTRAYFTSVTGTCANCTT